MICCDLYVYKRYITWNRFVEYTRIRSGVFHQKSSLSHIGEKETWKYHESESDLDEQSCMRFKKAKKFKYFYIFIRGFTNLY